MERIVITFEQDGSFRGASANDFAGLPQPLDVDALTALFPTVDAASLARVAELETERDEAVTAKDAATNELDTANARIAELEAVPEPVGGVTKLTIKRRLDALGPEKWPTLKAALATFPESLQDEWTLAQEISATDQMFVSNADAFKSLLGLTDEQFAALLTP